jgi:hypothetical protein
MLSRLSQSRLGSNPWVVSGTWVFVAVAVMLLSGRPLRGQAPNPEVQPDVQTRVLTAGQAVGQTFVPEMGGLSRVDVYLATHGQSNPGAVVFHLKRSPAAPSDLATVRVAAVQIQDNQFQAFEFPPLPADTKGEALYFYLESPPGEPVRTISAWGYSADLYPGGQAQLASGASAADLVFRLFYLPSPPERLAVVLNRLAASKPSVLGWQGGYIALGLVYGGLLIGVGWCLAREARNWDQPKRG